METRREVLSRSIRIGCAAMSVAVVPGLAWAEAPAYPSAAFEAKSIADALKALGLKALTESTEVTLTAPDIAENGAVVPVAASTSLADVRSVLILVENNPAVLSAMFEVTPAIEPAFSTRVKMGQTSTVYAVAVTRDGRALAAKKEVKVTMGGCGG